MAFDYEVLIIGTGFGATVTATELAAKHPNVSGKPNILMLERGVWWFTPERRFPQPFGPNIDSKYPPGDRLSNPYTKHPVQYWPRPDHRRGVLELLNVVWANLPGGDRRDFSNAPQPLYRYHAFDEIDILTANGVGGGSLVYSNVSIEPYFDASSSAYPVMDTWPMQLAQSDYNSARTWMSTYRGGPSKVVTKFPIMTDFATRLDDPHNDDERFAYLGKCRYLKEASEKLAADAGFTSKYEVLEKWKPLELAIIEYPDPAGDLDKKAYCERQGRCFLGCLPGARHTLNKTIINNLLYKAGVQPAVELRSLAEVSRLEKLATGGWRVHYEDLRFGDNDAGRHKNVSAKTVIVSAGCLGTNQLMLRAKANGLLLSNTVGDGFSTNGDFAGFIDYQRDFDHPINLNPRPYGIYATRGPINASHVMFRKGQVYVNFEDATVPPMLAPFVRAAVDVAQRAASDRQALFNELTTMWNLNFEDLSEHPDARMPGAYMTEHEKLQHTFFFNLMGRDLGRGVFTLNGHNELQLNFPGAPLRSDPVYAQMEEIVLAMANAMNGKYIRFPFWGGGRILDNQPDPERKFLTVHPLGGCNMSTDSSTGVVNAQGQVFDTTGGSSTVHDGLYIADAAVIPGPLAVNPTLTIVAMAKKIAAAIP